MNERYIEETLNDLRMNKTLLWTALIVTSGGTAGVFFKALNAQNPVFEWLFAFLGVILICILLKLIDEISSEISNLILYLKKKGVQ